MYSVSIKIIYQEGTPKDKQLQFADEKGRLLFSPLEFASRLVSYSQNISALFIEKLEVVSLVESNKFDANLPSKEDAEQFFLDIQKLKTQNPDIEINDLTMSSIYSKFLTKDIPNTNKKFFDNSSKESSQDQYLLMMATYTGLTLLLTGGVLYANSLLIFISIIALIAVNFYFLLFPLPEQCGIMPMMSRVF